MQKMNAIERVRKEIASIISRSPVPEDPLHSRNTLEWVLRLTPHPSVALQIAALGHDIERATPDRRVKKDAFRDYDSFKLAHARESARILTDLIRRCGVKDEALIASVKELVEKHELGGTPEADILKDADGLSFFDVNLPLYYLREGWQEALRRSLWGYRRLSERAKEMLQYLTPESLVVQRLIERTKRLTQWGMF